MISKEFLENLVALDDEGLLGHSSFDEPAVADAVDVAKNREKEVYDWIERNGRVPEESSDDITEHCLAMRYKSMRKDDDVYAPTTLMDIFQSPDFRERMEEMKVSELRDFSGSGIKPHRKNVADYIANRTHIDDFSLYYPLFCTVQTDVEKNIRKIVPFSTADIKAGTFCIAGGILCLIEEVYEPERTSDGRMDNRLHVVFANHTESYMFSDTLRKLMSKKNGRTITEPEKSVFGFKDNERLPEDRDTGYIYILRSLSDEPEVKQFGKDFYKIGYTCGSVEKRIANAEKEATYLRAPVNIVEKWRCTNINPRTLETFLHKFLQGGQIKIRVNDRDGSQIASEWYNVPIGVLDTMIPKILDGTILQYRYDADSKRLVFV